MERTKVKTAAFHTLGCKVNQYETEAIEEQFIRLGFKVVDFSEKADVYVINTCSVTQIAARKSRQMLHKAKKENPDALIVAAGCYAEEDRNKILSDKTADMAFGSNRKNLIARKVLNRLEKEDGCVESVISDVVGSDIFEHDILRISDFEEQEISSFKDRRQAYIKIQDGCSRFCSYCAIPYLRGRSRCRDAENIIAEAERLAKAGYKEIVLTGIDISSYEASLKSAALSSDAKSEEAKKFSGYGEEVMDLAYLVEKINGIPGIKTIHLGSLECGVITDDFLSRLASCEAFYPHFHLSLQSGSDSVLKRMNRHYTTAEYHAKVNLIRNYFKEAALTTDIIVGFPGETEEEFEETCRFVKTINFNKVHVFKFSKRNGTRAAKMPCQLTDKEKTVRSKALIKLTDRISKAVNTQLSLEDM